jgi:chemotaxis protein methyltransferase CheR
VTIGRINVAGRHVAARPELFEVLAHMLEEMCGVHYGAENGEIFASKLAAHARERGHHSLLDYYDRLRSDKPGGVELQKLVEATVVHETFFFRELAPLIELVNGHLREIVCTRGRARVWSAACSTGEEPFTLAMLLADAGLLDQVEIVASDVSTTAIARAMAGQHEERALRDGHPQDRARRYLTATTEGIMVAPRIRDAVRFQVLNLLDDDAVRGLGRFDAILCRNVLIYFRDDRITAMLDRLARSLEPRGLLAVGVTESLYRFGGALVCEQHGSSFFYRSAR